MTSLIIAALTIAIVGGSLALALCRSAALADRAAAAHPEWPEFDVLGEVGNRSRDGWVPK